MVCNWERSVFNSDNNWISMVSVICVTNSKKNMCPGSCMFQLWVIPWIIYISYLGILHRFCHFAAGEFHKDIKFKSSATLLYGTYILYLWHPPKPLIMGLKLFWIRTSLFNNSFKGVIKDQLNTNCRKWKCVSWVSAFFTLGVLS